MTVDEAIALKNTLQGLRDRLFCEIVERATIGLEGDFLLWVLQFCEAASFVGHVQCQLLGGKLVPEERVHHAKLTSNLVDRLPALRFRIGHDLADTLIVHIVTEAADYWREQMALTEVGGSA